MGWKRRLKGHHPYNFGIYLESQGGAPKEARFVGSDEYMFRGLQNIEL